jgi:hypothetical protein
MTAGIVLLFLVAPLVVALSSLRLALPATLAWTIEGRNGS